MRVSNMDLEILANIIIQKLDEEFQAKHLSKNLINTLEIKVEDHKIQIIINAPAYDTMKFISDGVIVPTSGSYASQLDTTGSEFYVHTKNGKEILLTPHNHKGYVEIVINKAIEEWLSKLNGWNLKGWKGEITTL